MTNRRIYMLWRLKDNEITLWSNLKKLYDEINHKMEKKPSYWTLSKAMKAVKQYKFIMENEVWVIVVKELN